MLKRPLNLQFSQAVLDGIKTTTIRKNPWPIGKPIMLYNWSGIAYRSHQIDVAPIVVIETTEIEITRNVLGMGYWVKSTDVFIEGLWMTEGFKSQKDMDLWFSKLVKCGQSLTRHLMKFRLYNARADGRGAIGQPSNETE